MSPKYIVSTARVQISKFVSSVLENYALGYGGKSSRCSLNAATFPPRASQSV